MILIKAGKANFEKDGSFMIGAGETSQVKMGN